MNKAKSLTIAGLLLASFLGVGSAQAGDDMLGSYVARISDRDHHASDGYELSSAAQMVRQDRANWHKFHRRDADDQGDDWFRRPRVSGTHAEAQRRNEVLDTACHRQWRAADPGRRLSRQCACEHFGGLTSSTSGRLTKSVSGKTDGVGFKRADKVGLDNKKGGV